MVSLTHDAREPPELRTNSGRLGVGIRRDGTGRVLTTSTAATVSTTVAYQGLVIAVEASDSGALDWLEEFLAPAFARSDARSARYRVVLVDDAEAYANLVERTAGLASTPTRCFALDRGFATFPSWTLPGGERVVLDGDSRVLYLVDPDGVRIRIVADRPLSPRRISLMRVVRELVMGQAWATSGLVVHGAALALGETGVMIAGPKGAGKTSLLLHLLFHAPGACFVSNDRVVVEFDATPRLRGLPTVVTVRTHTLSLYPELEPRLARRQYDVRLLSGETSDAPIVTRANSDARLIVAPAQLCEILGVAMRGSVTAGVLLLPQLAPDDDGARLTPVSSRVAADALKACVIGGEPAPATSDVFGASSRGHQPVDREELDRRLLAFTEGVRCFECRLGRHAYGREAAGGLLELLADGEDGRRL